MRYKILFIILLFLLINVNVYGAGTTSAEFLKIGPNARAVAMGGAFTSISDDVSSMYWNIAGLSQQKDTQILLTHGIWIEGITYDYLAFGYPLIEEGKIGVSITYLSSGKVKGYDVDGNETSEFSNYDLAGTIGYSHKLTFPITETPMYIGLSIKYIYEKLENEKATAFALDIGDIHQFGDLSVGIVIQNLGSKIKFVSDSFPLPMNIKVGSAYRLLEDNLILALDVNFPKGSNIVIAGGGEYRLDLGEFTFAGRAGYNTRVSKELGNLTGITGGIGFGYSGIIIDYAWVPFGDLGQTHQISLSYRF